MVGARRDPVLLAGALLIAGGLAARAAIAVGGFHASDDFTLTERALASGLDLRYLLTPWNNHVMPGGLATYWLFSRLTGLAYWPYVVLFLIGQAAAAVVFFRLSRRLLGRGWLPLVGLAMFQFAPITMEITACVSTGLMFVPAQLAMVWALSAQERYIATRRSRYLVSLGAALGFGLCFFEKTLTSVPLVFLFTACLYCSGGPLRSVGQALREYWRSWAVLGGLSVVYLAGYLRLGESGELVRSAPAHEVAEFLVGYFGKMLIPGLVGGPVVWLPSGGGPTIVDTPTAVAWASLVVVAAIVVVTTLRRPAAARAWVLLAAYAAIAAGLIAATRVSVLALFGYDEMPRFGSDVLVVAALCLGVAIAGMPGDPPARPLPRWMRSAPATAAAYAVPAAVVLATVVSDVRLADAWSQNVARDYLRTAQAEVAAMPPGTVYFDRFVTEKVIWPLLPPEERWQSRLLAADKGPRLAVVPAGEEIFVLDDEGHVRPLALDGVSTGDGPAGCGWPVEGGRTVTIPLTGRVEASWPALRIDYLAATDATARVTVGEVSLDFPVRAGDHHYYLRLDVAHLLTPDRVELSLPDPAAQLCAHRLTVGEVVPGPGGPSPMR